MRQDKGQERLQLHLLPVSSQETGRQEEKTGWGGAAGLSLSPPLPHNPETCKKRIWPAGSSCPSSRNPELPQDHPGSCHRGRKSSTTHVGPPAPLLGCPKRGPRGQGPGNNPGEFSGSRGGGARGAMQPSSKSGVPNPRDAAWCRGAAHWELGHASSGRAPEPRKLRLPKAVGAQGKNILRPAASTATGSHSQKGSP